MNSLYQQLNPINQQTNNDFLLLLQQAKQSNNPAEFLYSAAKTNPQLASILAMVNRDGVTLKDAALNLARQQGIDPAQIIAVLK